MGEKQEMHEINPEELSDEVMRLAADGCRLVQISCTKLKDLFEINYSFDKAYHFINLRITIGAENTGIHSISGIIPAAVMYENEIHDLYGIKVHGLTMDYNGTLYKTAIKTPFIV